MSNGEYAIYESAIDLDGRIYGPTCLSVGHSYEDALSYREAWGCETAEDLKARYLRSKTYYIVWQRMVEQKLMERIERLQARLRGALEIMDAQSRAGEHVLSHVPHPRALAEIEQCHFIWQLRDHPTWQDIKLGAECIWGAGE